MARYNRASIYYTRSIIRLAPLLLDLKKAKMYIEL